MSKFNDHLFGSKKSMAKTERSQAKRRKHQEKPSRLATIKSVAEAMALRKEEDKSHTADVLDLDFGDINE